MPKGKLFPMLFLFTVAVLFLYGMIHLLVLRFEKGDIYPAYSSFRSDPLGTKVFYEGLRLLPGIETTRNLEPLQKVSELSEATLFLFGLRESDFCEMEQGLAQKLEEVALSGGRVAISIFPTKSSAAPWLSDKRQEPARRDNVGKPEEGEQTTEEEQEFYRRHTVNLSERWSVDIGDSPGKDAEANLSATEKDLPSSLAWHSTLCFKPQGDVWQLVYVRAGKAVLIERSFGKGSIVLFSDSYFLSNEAMKNDRFPRLLSWLCGSHKKIIFDEIHLGIQKSPGIATLLRKYGLGPFLISLLVLALFAVWKQSARFVPVCEEEEKPLVELGKDSSNALTNLLYRNISHNDILMACLQEWERSFTHGHQNFSALLPRIQNIIAQERAQPRKKRNPVQAYRQISELCTGPRKIPGAGERVFRLCFSDTEPNHDMV